MDDPNSFVAALNEHDMARLRNAFEAAKTATGEKYDRTTLNRWMDGSVPSKEGFVRQLATELDDEDVFSAWQQARRSQTPSQGRAVVSRYRGLSDEEKDKVFHEIRDDYLSTFPSARRRMAYQVEVNDPPSPDDEYLVIRFTLTWSGAIPERASVVIATEHTRFAEAYSDPDCIFREILDFEPGRLSELLESGPEPILAINPLDSRAPRGAHHIGQQDEPGLFRFDNAEAAEAEVRLSLAYPYRRGQGVFFIRFGRYQVPDNWSATLRLNSRSTSSPRAFPYLPPGRQREFSQSFLGSDELFLTVGTGNTTVYGEGDGLVLYWTES
ncbi:MAG: hypothetical protein AAGA93_08355 [Actinomycetota bacterium]